MRHAARTNVEWETPIDRFEWQHVTLEVLMDIRNELQRLNKLLYCQNFIEIPRTLRTISLNTHKPKGKK